MISRLPFEALRAFVHAARSSSFRIASEKLNISRGAVTQRIATLETHLGETLFKRTPQGIELLPAGVSLLRDTGQEIDVIEARLTPSSGVKHLRIHTVSSFANLWLIPRLGRFNREHPDIKVSLQTGISLTDLRKGGVTADVALRYGAGRYPGLVAREVLRPNLCLIAAPGLLDAAGPATDADLLRRFHLVRGNQECEWQFWFDKLGVSPQAVSWGASLEDDANVIEAVLAGQGIGCVRDLYIGDHLRTGRLKRLAVSEAPAGAFFLVGNKERMACKDTNAFFNWLMDEVTASPPG